MSRVRVRAWLRTVFSELQKLNLDAPCALSSLEPVMKHMLILNSDLFGAV